jgi:hypothetical protein
MAGDDVVTGCGAPFQVAIDGCLVWPPQCFDGLGCKSELAKLSVAGSPDTGGVLKGLQQQLVRDCPHAWGVVQG